MFSRKIRKKQIISCFYLKVFTILHLKLKSLTKYCSRKSRFYSFNLFTLVLYRGKGLKPIVVAFGKHLSIYLVFEISLVWQTDYLSRKIKIPHSFERNGTRLRFNFVSFSRNIVLFPQCRHFSPLSIFGPISSPLHISLLEEVKDPKLSFCLFFGYHSTVVTIEPCNVSAAGSIPTIDIFCFESSQITDFLRTFRPCCLNVSRRFRVEL